MVSSNPIFHRPWSLASFDFKNLTATPTYIDDVRTALPAMWFANMDRQNARRNWGRFFGTKNTVVLFLLCVGWWGGGHARCIDIPRTQLTSIFQGQPSKTRPFPIKTRVTWVLGIQLYICYQDGNWLPSYLLWMRSLPAKFQHRDDIFSRINPYL